MITTNEARRLVERLDGHIKQLTRVVDDIKFEAALLEEIADGSIAAPESRDSVQIILEATADARELLDSIDAIARGEATDSSFDPENKSRFIL